MPRPLGTRLFGKTMFGSSVGRLVAHNKSGEVCDMNLNLLTAFQMDKVVEYHRHPLTEFRRC